MAAEQFEVSITEAEIADLREGLRRTRWPARARAGGRLVPGVAAGLCAEALQQLGRGLRLRLRQAAQRFPPSGLSVYPRDTTRPSRREAELRFTDLRWFEELPHGGQFAALEQPESLVEQVRGFFRLSTERPSYPESGLTKGL